MDVNRFPDPTPSGETEVEVVGQIYEAMASKDLGRLFELLDPEVVITQDPANCRGVGATRATTASPPSG